MDLIRTQQFSPCIAYDNNEPKEFSAFLLTGLTEYRLQTFDSISEVLYTYYNSRSAIARMRQKSADLRHLVQNLIERTAKKAVFKDDSFLTPISVKNTAPMASF